MIRIFSRSLLNRVGRGACPFIYSKGVSTPAVGAQTFSTTNRPSPQRQRQPPHQIICWKCAKSTAINKYFCPHCSVLLDVSRIEGLNYFKLLGLEERFELDQNQLSEKCRSLQKVLHPDLYSGRGPLLTATSERLSSLINQIQSVLSNPVRRGHHLYEIKYGKYELETSKYSNQEFLQEMMELNEELELLRDENSWGEMRSRIKGVMISLEGHLSSLFKNGDENEIKLALSKLKYYESLYTKLGEKKLELGVVE